MALKRGQTQSRSNISFTGRPEVCVLGISVFQIFQGLLDYYRYLRDSLGFSQGDPWLSLQAHSLIVSLAILTFSQFFKQAKLSVLKDLVHFVPRTHISLHVEWMALLLPLSLGVLEAILAFPSSCCLMLPIPFLVSIGLHLFLFTFNIYQFLYQSSYETGLPEGLRLVVFTLYPQHLEHGSPSRHIRRVSESTKTGTLHIF